MFDLFIHKILTRLRALLIILLFASIDVFAQHVNSPIEDTTATIRTVSILPDRNYTINQILTDRSLKFEQINSIRPNKIEQFWFKLQIYNQSRYTEDYDIAIFPNYSNVLYYFNENEQKWVSNESSSMASTKGQQHWFLSCKLKGQANTILYVKCNFKTLSKLAQNLKPIIRIHKSSEQENLKHKIELAYITGITVLLLFFLSNLYMYFSFRDRIVIYFLVGQLGAIIYLTSYRQFFGRYLYNKVFDFGILSNSDVFYYDMDSLLMHVGIMLIMYGVTQLTRYYLNTKRFFPTLDRLLSYLMYSYTVISLLLILLNIFAVSLEHFTVFYDNIFVIIIALANLYTSVLGYRHKLPASGSFLFANALPLGLMMATPLFHIFINGNGVYNIWLPNLAIISNAFGFTIALVARTKAIQKELMKKKLEAQQLTFDIRELTLSRQVIEIENKQIANDIQYEKNQNQLMQEKLDANHRELASNTIYIAQKNQLLAGLKSQIKEMGTFHLAGKQENIQTIKSILQSNLHLDADWEKFRIHFEQVHPKFFENLRKKHPSLTKNEIRLYSYFHINMSTKEIANLLNIDPASVRRAKTRLFKKIGSKPS